MGGVKGRRCVSDPVSAEDQTQLTYIGKSTWSAPPKFTSSLILNWPILCVQPLSSLCILICSFLLLLGNRNRSICVEAKSLNSCQGSAKDSNRPRCVVFVSPDNKGGFVQSNHNELLPASASWTPSLNSFFINDVANGNVQVPCKYHIKLF